MVYLMIWQEKSHPMRTFGWDFSCCSLIVQNVFVRNSISRELRELPELPDLPEQALTDLPEQECCS